MTASRHLVSSQKACWKHLSNSELSMDKVVMAELDTDVEREETRIGKVEFGKEKEKAVGGDKG